MASRRRQAVESCPSANAIVSEHSMTHAFTLRLRGILAALVIAASLRAAAGQDISPPEGGAKPPEYQKLRYEEDYSYLRDSAERSDIWDPIKYIPFNRAGDWYLLLGGEARERYEFYNNYRWNPASPDKDGYLLQRYLLHADLHLGPSVRVFG